MISVRERVERVADRYIVTGHSIRKLAEHFKVSKTTIGYDLTIRAEQLLPYDKVQDIRKRCESNMREFRKYGHLIAIVDYPPDINADDPDTYGIMKDFMTEEDEGEFGYNEETDHSNGSDFDYTKLDDIMDLFG